ncbi:MAG: hypothetical protein JSS32_09560 [Verrucomicrobia bacterium]|nr:hypothetical protein [Verrucomicrobiota bacterium]
MIGNVTTSPVLPKFDTILSALDYDFSLSEQYTNVQDFLAHDRSLVALFAYLLAGAGSNSLEGLISSMESSTDPEDEKAVNDPRHAFINLVNQLNASKDGNPSMLQAAENGDLTSLAQDIINDNAAGNPIQGALETFLAQFPTQVNQ